MKKIILIAFLLMISQVLFSQIEPKMNNQKKVKSTYTENKFIPKTDSVRMVNLPELEIPLLYKSATSIQLPASVDNSTSVYFRPVTWQSGFECGQTAGQAFVFTYEINRLRNLNSSLTENQYPTHFSWNFLNNAYNYTGVSFFDTWEITRTCGTPNVVDYGGALNTGGEKRWITGYPKYYNGMKNRLSGVYSIKCDSPEGIRFLKTWLFDHLEGSSNGGVAAIYAQYCSPDTTLPIGTPEAGKALISLWGSSPSHAWTILGYNDSIRYDYNGDGQYTNHIDLNGDGIVNVKDWEIGGLKIVNGYAGTGWGNGGFAYMMYKSLADGISNGGIWNSSAYVIKAKQNQNPLLTMKINLKHNLRNQIKVIVGVSQNTSATNPDFRMEYPVFNFKGGALGMQGDTLESARSIEFGLDVTPLLSKVDVGIPAKYFLEVIEKDPGGTGVGQVNSFSIIDYTIGAYESIYPSSNIQLINNDTTRLSFIKAMVFDKLNIINDSMIAKIYHPYSHQLNAEFGAQPYKWSLKMDYNETTNNSPFPNTPTQVLNTGNSGSVMQNLNFRFPFFGKSYNQIYIYADGYIKFDNSIYTFPYLIDADLLFRSHKMIAPFYADLTYGIGQNVTFETDANSATIVWKAGVSGQTASSVNVAMKIYDNGKIEFYYGTISIAGNWISAISGGDVENYFYTTISNSFAYNNFQKKIELLPPDYPDDMLLTESGLFTTNATRLFNTTFKIKATDNNNVSTIKSIPFKTSGLIFDYKINAGGDTSINASDTVLISVKLMNIGISPIINANMQLQISDTNIIMIDSANTIASIAGGDSLELNNAFRFVVKNSVLDGHFIDLLGMVITPIDTFAKSISFRINSFLLKTGTITISDGNNNILEPNETAAIILQIKNVGGALATNIHLQLSTADPYVTLNPGFADIDSIQPYSFKNAFFIITTSANIPDDHLIVLNAEIDGNSNSTIKTYFFIQIGIPNEDFETNDFTKFEWSQGGNINWFTSDSLKYQGNYSAKSGKITHSQTSYLSINQYILADGFIKFHRKVSSEVDNTNHNYDYLAFFIDGTEKARWDGEKDWAQEIFPVTPGIHTFKWTYVKDYSVNGGADCAWLDNVIFPLFGDVSPDLSYSPLVVNKTIGLNTLDTAIVNLNNWGNGLVLFTNYLRIGNNSVVPWASINYSAGGINVNENQKIIIQFDATQLQVGNYNCELVINENFLVQKIIPVFLVVKDQTGIEENSSIKSNCFPNPFTKSTKISVNIKEKETVNITIYDYTGRLVNVIYDNKMLADGTYDFYWDACDYTGNHISEGLYFCNIKVNNKSITHKLVYAK